MAEKKYFIKELDGLGDCLFESTLIDKYLYIYVLILP